MKTKRFIQITLLLTPLIAMVVFSKQKENSRYNMVLNVADYLGQTPENHIFQTKDCWGIFPSSCGVRSDFIINSNLEILQKKLEHFDKKPSSLSVGVFGDNMDLITAHTISSDCPKNSGEDYALLARRWDWDDSNGYGRWSVKAYDVTESDCIYKVDGKVVTGSYVTVMLIYK